MTQGSDSKPLIERRSIDYIPANERHGRLYSQFTLWLGASLQIIAIATSALTVVLGDDVFQLLVDLLISQLLGGAVMALHAAQGPRLGLPQMISSRVQFGVYNAYIPIALVCLVCLGFTTTGTMLSSRAIGQLTGLNDSAGISIFTALIVLVTVSGYRVVHIIGQITSVLDIIAFVHLFSRLMLLSDIGDLLAIRHFSWASFLLAVSLAVSWRIAFGPCVAGYSRYLPASISSWKTFLAVGLGSMPDAQTSMALEAFSAALANGRFAGREAAYIVDLGSSGTIVALLYFSIAFGKVTISTLNSYGSFICITTIISSICGQLEITRLQRLFFVLAIVGASTLIALLGQHSFLAAFKPFILFLLTFFTPWGTVDLVGYYFIARERYDIPILVGPDGRYGRQNLPGIAVHILSVLVRVSFLTTTLYTGPMVEHLGDVDISWIIGLLVLAVLYYLVTQRKAVRQAPARMILPTDPGTFEYPAHGAQDESPGRRDRLQSHETPPADGAIEPAEPNEEFSMSLHLKPGQLTLADLRQVYLTPVRLSLDPSADAPIAASVACVENIIAEGRTAYGINTGFGLLASMWISPANLEELQCSIVLSHAAGAGEALDDATVRLVMLFKMNSLTHEFSGIRRKVIDVLITLINAEIYPHIPLKGSVGISDDLAPLAHMSLVLVGESRVRHHGEWLPATEALTVAGLEPLTLTAKEGLALLSGTQISIIYALRGLFEAKGLFAAATVCGGLSVEAMLDSRTPLDAHIHVARDQRGQIDVATAYRDLLTTSNEVARSHEKCDKVQDPYSLRCQPQAMGACLTQMRQVAEVLEIEANAVSDNPLVFATEGDMVSDGNFHAELVAMAVDNLALALAEIGSLSERRISLMMGMYMSQLPPFLVANGGANSSFMIAQITATALASDNKVLAYPANVDSLSTSVGQEDHVLMAPNTSKRLWAMAENVRGVLTVEWLGACRGLDFREGLKSSPRLEQARHLLRNKVPYYQEGRFLAPDIEAASQLLASGCLDALLPTRPLPSF